MSEISGKKFINLFSTLTKTEARDFRTYLKRQVGPGVAVDLLSYLLKFHPSFSNEGRLTLEALHHQLYHGEQEFSSKRILNLFSDLNRVLREFLRRTAQDADAAAVRFYELKVLYERGRSEAFFQETEKSLHSGIFSAPWAEMYGIRLRDMLLRHPAFKDHHKRLEQLRTIVEKLDGLYEPHRLRFGSVYLQLYRLLRGTQLPAELEIVGGLAEKVLATNAGAFSTAYAWGFKMEVQNDQQAFSQLLNLLTGEPGNVLDGQTQHELLTMLLNFAYRQIKAKQETFWAKAFDLYHWGLKTGALRAELGLQPDKFNNMVVVACHERQFSWARIFIEKYRQYLPEGERAPAVALARVNVDVEEGDVERALEQIAQLHFDHPFQNLRLRTLELRALFDLYGGTDNDIIFYKVRQLRHFVDSNELQQENREMVLNFCRMINELHDRGKPVREIRQFLADCKAIFFQKWLEEKLNGYKPV